MNPIVIDIETAPLPANRLAEVMPEFEPSKVLKDPEKIKADVEGKKREWIEKAALSAKTGTVLMIGIKTSTLSLIWDDMPEKELLSSLWKLLNEISPFHCIGHNVKFDLPFLTQRSFVHRVSDDIPVCLRMVKGRFFSDVVEDTMETWACGSQDKISLNHLCQTLGIEMKKMAQEDGGKFLPYQHWTTEAEKDQCRAYLKRDLDMTWEAAKAMRIIQ